MTVDPFESRHLARTYRVQFRYHLGRTRRLAHLVGADDLARVRDRLGARRNVHCLDRHAARDLWDLWALTHLGAIDTAAKDLYRRYGPTNRPPAPHDFQKAPTEREWQNQLAGQTRLEVTARDALRAVRDAWAQVSGST